MVVVVTACSSGDDDRSSEDASQADPNGILRYAANLAAASNGTTNFDPTKGVTQTDEPYLTAVYDTLLRARPDGSFDPALAEKVTIVDPQTIELTLRNNLKFTDGTALDAQAAKFSLMRNRTTGNASAYRAEYALLTEVEVVNATTFRIKLSKPSVGAYYPLLAGTETTIVSPAAVSSGKDLNSSPVGAGPFTLVSYQASQKIVFKKNPGYWDAEHIRLGGFEVIGVATGPQTQTALRSGQVDMIAISPSDAAQLSDYGISLRADSNSTLQIPICKTRKPLDDVRVRQALNFATDKDELNKALLDGKGEPMEALFTKDSAFFPKSLDGKYDYNPTKAKQLLTTAGVAEGTEIGIITIAGSTTSERWAEILQQQWAKVGIKLKIVPSTAIGQDFYLSNREPLFTLPFVRGGISKVTTQYVGDTVGNVCRWSDPELNALVDKLGAVATDSPQAVTLWQQTQERIFDQALSIWALFQPITWAYDDKKLSDVSAVAGLIQYPDYFSIYVKKP